MLAMVTPQVYVKYMKNIILLIIVLILSKKYHGLQIRDTESVFVNNWVFENKELINNEGE